MSEGKNREIQIPQEEMESIISLREEILKNIEVVGRISIRKGMLEGELGSLNNDLGVALEESKVLDAREKEKINEIVGKYGEGQLDFQTGIYYLQEGEDA